MTVEATIQSILTAGTWTQRIQQIRLVPQRHGTEDHGTIYAAVARELYVPYLAPDFAFIHDAPFYDADHFDAVYAAASDGTDNFTTVGVDDLAILIENNPQTLLVFRTITEASRRLTDKTASALTNKTIGRDSSFFWQWYTPFNVLSGINLDRKSVV